MAVPFEKAAKVDERGVAPNFLGNALPRLGARGSGTVRNWKRTLDYGCSLHHSGHRTLRGVRVAFTTVR
jgi:hypothetical protein